MSKMPLGSPEGGEQTPETLKSLTTEQLQEKFKNAAGEIERINSQCAVLLAEAERRISQANPQSPQVSIDQSAQWGHEKFAQWGFTNDASQVIQALQGAMRNLESLGFRLPSLVPLSNAGIENIRKLITKLTSQINETNS